MLGPWPWALVGLPPPLPPSAASGPFTHSPALSCLHWLLGTPAQANALPFPGRHYGFCLDAYLQCSERLCAWVQYTGLSAVALSGILSGRKGNNTLRWAGFDGSLM